nr:hypothetical protein [Kribbella sindirgiensis]
MVVDMVRIGQHRYVLGRQGVAPFGGSRGHVVDVDQSAGGVVLQPLADVALVGAGAFGQLDRRRRALLGERLVQPQTLAEVDGVELERRSGVPEDPLDECVGPVHELDRTFVR